MAKKLILVSPVLVCAGVIIALVLLGAGGARAEATAAEIERAKAEIRALLKSGEYEQAQSSIESLQVQFSDDSGLAETLYDIAREYRWVKKYDVARNMYQQIIEQYPQSASSDRARLGLARIDILFLISSQKDAEAATAVGKLVKDFSGHGDLPETLYWIAKEYEWKMLLQQSKATYQHIIDSCPNSSYVSKAQVGIARVSAGALVESGDLAGANAALDRLMVDFAGHEDLPWTLYWLTKRYEGPNEFEKAKAIYQHIIQQWPDSNYAQQAELDIRMLDVFQILTDAKYDKAFEAIDDLMTEYLESTYIATVLFHTAEDYCYERADALEESGDHTAAEASLLAAPVIWEKALERYPQNADILPDIYELSALCYEKTGNYAKAIEWYKKFVLRWPEHKMTWHYQFLIGNYYQRLADEGGILPQEADEQTRAAYERLLEKYPECKAAEAAQNWLKAHQK